MPDNPYTHFNDLKSTCYMRLWELEGGDGDQAEVGIGFAGGGNWDDEDEASDGDTSDSFDSDEEDNFEDFGPDDDFIHFSDEEDDSSDDEPGPDQRPAQARDVRIEIVNFARARGAANPRIFQNVRRAPPPPAPPPPPVPVPPRRARGGQRAGRQRGQVRQQPEAGRRNLPGVPGFAHGAQDVRAQIQADARDHLDAHDADNAEREIIRVGPAPGQGHGAAQQPAPLRAMGLERFLELAQRDQEDEWDSDELYD